MKTLVATAMVVVCAAVMKAQTNPAEGSRWLAKSDVAPQFAVPATREAWETRRLEVRSELWKMLGRLPPRPAKPAVETLSREDRGDYMVEKFQFDNGAGSTVPGYI